MKSLLVVLCSLSFASLFGEMVFVAPGNPSLSMPSLEVAEEDINSDPIQAIITKMFEIARGERQELQGKVMVGLAAPQIGINKQIILVDTGLTEGRELGELKAYINPKIVSRSNETLLGREGCYSVDSHLVGLVERSQTIIITAFDQNGNRITEELSGMPARVFQHEVDHLYGIRFPDHVQEGHLHWVEDHEYPEYREHFLSWPSLVSRETWLSMKAGKM